MLKRKFAITLAVAMVMAALYGCSSGVSDSTHNNVKDELAAANAMIAQLQMDLADANTALATANGNVADLRMQLTNAMDHGSSLQMQLDAANAEVTRLTGELATSTGNADNLQMQLDAAKADVTRLQGMVDANATMISQLQMDLADANKRADDAEAELAQIKKDAADALADAAQKEKMDRGNAVATAIGAARVVAGTARPLPGAASSVTAVTAKRNTAGTVTVELGDAKGYTGGEGPAGSDGWTGVMLSRTNENKSEDQVVVYTDIAAPKPTTLAAELERGAVTIDQDEERMRIMPDALPVGDATLSYSANDDFEGTYRGIAGTFTCTGTCTVTLDDDGDPVVAGDSNFVPDTIASTYDAPDANYVYFGWWLNKPEKADGTHMVEAFAGGTTGHAAEATAAMEGKATYSGPAAGKYVTKTFTAGVLTDAEAGHFTATATLNADFLDASDTGTITGEVTGFENSGEVDGSGWVVKLMLGYQSGTTTEVDSNIAAADATFDGRTSVNFGGGEHADAGNWEGSFYGGGGTESPNAHPSTVAGIFDAVTPNASITGGFGGTKQSE